MSDNEQMRVLAQQLWKNYMEPQVDKKLALVVKYFRAEVVSNPGDNTLEVKRPLDATTMTLPCTNGMTGAEEGDQCVVFVFGSLSNAVVVSDGMFRSLDASMESVVTVNGVRLTTLEARVSSAEHWLSTLDGRVTVLENAASNEGG